LDSKLEEKYNYYVTKIQNVLMSEHVTC
jgi:hypothetical protein